MSTNDSIRPWPTVASNQLGDFNIFKPVFDKEEAYLGPLLPDSGATPPPLGFGGVCWRGKTAGGGSENCGFALEFNRLSLGFRRICWTCEIAGGGSNLTRTVNRIFFVRNFDS